MNKNEEIRKKCLFYLIGASAGSVGLKYMCIVIIFFYIACSAWNLIGYCSTASLKPNQTGVVFYGMV